MRYKFDCVNAMNKIKECAEGMKSLKPLPPLPDGDFLAVTLDEYNAIENMDEESLYYIRDTKEFYHGHSRIYPSTEEMKWFGGIKS